jgi:putative transposase
MIAANKQPLSIAKMSRLLDVSESGYRKWSSREPKGYDPKLISEIHRIKEEFFFYGYRRVDEELRRRGYKVNHKRVLRLMRKEKLIVVKRKVTPKTTQSNHSFKRYPNLLDAFVPSAINQAWVSDITYVPIGNKFAYLATLMDLWSRKIVGWHLSWEMDRYLTLTALYKAVQLRGFRNLQDCICHSDHGSQYLCGDYITKLNDLGMKPSMGEVGNSYDNAFAESLNKTIKYEAVYPNEFETFEEAKKAIADHIKLYNQRRLHSGIGYLPPDEFEKKNGGFK